MRAFWYTILFIAPTVLVLVYRTQIQEYLTEKGIIGRPPAKSAPAGPNTEPNGAANPIVEQDNTQTATPKPNLPGPAVDAGEEFDLEVNTKYPLPDFKPLATVVGNWQEIPANAYPERVTLKKPVELSLIIAGKASGKSKLKVGQSAYPVALQGSQLTISGSPGKQGTRGTINIDDTDFKRQVEKKYSAWKASQTARVKKLRKEAKARLMSANRPADTPSTASGPSTNGGSLGPEPKRSTDGSVPVMVASIKAGHVTEIQLDKIDYWRWIGIDTVGGRTYWAGVVGYVAHTIFGDIKTEGKALIRNGKVVKWVYSGSEEAIK